MLNSGIQAVQGVDRDGVVYGYCDTGWYIQWHLSTTVADKIEFTLDLDIETEQLCTYRAAGVDVRRWLRNNRPSATGSGFGSGEYENLLARVHAARSAAEGVTS